MHLYEHSPNKNFTYLNLALILLDCGLIYQLLAINKKSKE